MTAAPSDDLSYHPRSNRGDDVPTRALLHGLLGWPLILVPIPVIFIAALIAFGGESPFLVVIALPFSAHMVLVQLSSVRLPPSMDEPVWLSTSLPECCLELSVGEVVVRDDLVFRMENLIAGTCQICRLVVTNRRIAFLPADLPDWYSLLSVLSSSKSGQREMKKPLGEHLITDLHDVVLVTSWRPAFSAPPAVQIGTNNISFQLINEQALWQTPAPRERVETHFTQVEGAWKAAIGMPVS